MNIQCIIYTINGLPWWLRMQCRRPGFHPWVWEIPWRRKGLPTPVFLPGEFLGERSLAGYCPLGRKELDTTELTSLQNSNSEGEDVRRLECEFGVSRHKLLWIINKVLLYSTGNYIQFPMINHNGNEYEKECMCMCIESLCFSAEFNTTLKINYTSI